MSTHEYEPIYIEPSQGVESAAENIVGFYAMPIMSDVSNTGDRLQTMVDQLGVPFVAADLFAQRKRSVYGYAAREANKVTGDIYRDMSLHRLDFVRNALSRYGNATVLGMGDSLGVPAVQGMQIHGENDARFEALLLRDGWNFKGKVSMIRGLGRYGLYQIRDAVLSSGDREVKEYGYADQSPAAPNETSLIQKLVNVADTMRGFENRNNAVLLAAKAATAHEAAINFVCFDHGLSGSESEAQDFKVDLFTAYNNTLRELPNDDRQQKRIRVDIISGWHSDLLNPALGAQDVRNTLELL